MVTLVNREFVERAPEDAVFVVMDLNFAPVKKRFAIFHAKMGRLIAVRQRAPKKTP